MGKRPNLVLAVCGNKPLMCHTAQAQSMALCIAWQHVQQAGCFKTHVFATKVTENANAVNN